MQRKVDCQEDDAFMKKHVIHLHIKCIYVVSASGNGRFVPSFQFAPWHDWHCVLEYEDMEGHNCAGFMCFQLFLPFSLIQKLHWSTQDPNLKSKLYLRAYNQENKKHLKPKTYSI